MTEAPLPNIIQLTEQFQAALAIKDAATLKRLTDAYLRVYKTLKLNIENLVQAVELAGGTMTRGQVVRLSQYKNLLAAVESEITAYSGFLKIELPGVAEIAISDGTISTHAILAETLGHDAVLVESLQTLNPRVTETLLGFLDPGGELFKRLNFYGPEAASRTAATIIESVTLGRGPRVLASSIRDALGMTLTDSLRTARTVQLWSYREATRANYVANEHLVKGWWWHAELDGLTCPSCIANHGKEFPLSETLDDHYNGRCAMIPKTITNPNLSFEKGEDWFGDQPEAFQRKALGKGRYEAWKNGEFEFGQLSTKRADGVYGTMQVPAPLKDLTNGN